MTKEDKELLLKDLCSRLPYRTKMLFNNKHKFILSQINPCQFAGEAGYGVIFDFGGKIYNVEDCKPYLRPMSSMTEEEYKELKKISDYYGLAPFNYIYDWGPNYEMIDWLNKHLFDYRGLIEKGLAIEAPDNMYKIV